MKSINCYKYNIGSPRENIYTIITQTIAWAIKTQLVDPSSYAVRLNPGRSIYRAWLSRCAVPKIIEVFL